MPSARFHSMVPRGSILIDGTPASSSASPSSSSSGKGCLYASTSSNISPIYTIAANCSISSGNKEGSSPTSHLPSAYALGRVASFQSSFVIAGQIDTNITSTQTRTPSPNVLTVKATNSYGTNYIVHCQAPSAPGKGETYTYHTTLMFLHPILIHSHKFWWGLQFYLLHRQSCVVLPKGTLWHGKGYVYRKAQTKVWPRNIVATSFAIGHEDN